MEGEPPDLHLGPRPHRTRQYQRPNGPQSDSPRNTLGTRPPKKKPCEGVNPKASPLSKKRGLGYQDYFAIKCYRHVQTSVHATAIPPPRAIRGMRRGFRRVEPQGPDTSNRSHTFKGRPATIHGLVPPADDTYPPEAGLPKIVNWNWLSTAAPAVDHMFTRHSTPASVTVPNRALELTAVTTTVWTVFE
ncbi:MAG: hypothetical protein HONBIEJF_00208 [Fimbriimonadaceae bacterium]|nr:hypothetical protein [Fimbriimonadaceae bacterium]